MKKPIGIGLVTLGLLGGTTLGVYALQGTRINTNSIETTRQALIHRLDDAIAQELKQGEVSGQGDELTVVGDSTDRIQKLERSTMQKVDALTARSVTEREPAIHAIHLFANNQTIDPVYQFSTVSDYSAATPTEIYYVGTDQYEINALTNQIIQFGPRPLTSNDPVPSPIKTIPKISKEQLQQQATAIASNASGVNLDRLVLRQTNKAETVYFFRWEDVSTHSDDMKPFIQVGISAGGQIVSYTNTINL